MRRIWIGTAAAALATAFVIPVALAQETQQGKQPSATEGSGASGGMHRNSGPAPTGQRANQAGTQTQGMQGQMGQNERERDQFGKGEMKGGSGPERTSPEPTLRECRLRPSRMTANAISRAKGK